MRFPAAAGMASFLLVWTTGAQALECRPDIAIISGAGAPVSIPVEIADDPAERARGLMGRSAVAPGTGMLFIFEQPQPVSFWMHDTRIPLDMLFIDETGEIRHIHPRARPMDDRPIPGAAVGDPAPERLMVLELPGGDAERLGIRPGMVLAHPRLPQDRARLRCD